VILKCDIQKWQNCRFVFKNEFPYICGFKNAFKSQNFKNVPLNTFFFFCDKFKITLLIYEITMTNAFLESALILGYEVIEGCL
jgi:hypothetical protein